MYTVTMVDVAQIMRYYDADRRVRSKTDPIRWEAFRYANHRLPEYNTGHTPFKTKELMSDTGRDALSMLDRGVMNSMMSPNSPWFELEVVKGEEYLDEARALEWAQDAQRRMMREFAASDLYDQADLANMDSIVGGYSCMEIRQGEKGLEFKTYIPWDCWYHMDRYGRCDRFFHEVWYTGQELLLEFSGLSEKIRKSAMESLNEPVFRVLHAIVSRERYLGGDGKPAKFKTKKPWASIYILSPTGAAGSVDGDGVILDESGFDTFPIVIHVWQHTSDSQYGVGLVMKSLSLFKTLDRLTYEYGLAIAKMNHPPILLDENMEEEFSDNPEAINYVNRNNLIPTPMYPQADIAAIKDAMNWAESAVRKVCFNDFMSFYTNHEKVYTATQVNSVKNESLQQMEPITQNLMKHKIVPILELSLELLIKMGRVKDPREALQMRGKGGSKVRFKAVSALAKQLEYATDTYAISQVLELSASVMQVTQDPSIASNRVDFDQMFKMAVMATGVDYRVLRDDDEVERLQTAQAQALSEKMQMERALSESQVNRNNAAAGNNPMGVNT